MTSPGSATEETASLKHLHQQELESGAGEAGGNSDRELVGLVVGGAEMKPEKWGKGLGQGSEDKKLGWGWGGRQPGKMCREGRREGDSIQHQTT